MTDLARTLRVLGECAADGRLWAADPTLDVKGGYTRSLAMDYRGLAVCEYCVNHDISLFRSYMSESADLVVSLLRRFDAGEPISGSYATMLKYKSLFDLLAAGEMERAEQFAKLLGGRDDVEKRFDTAFDRKLGYALKAIVERGADRQRRAKDFAEECAKEKNRNFRGYSTMFQAILSNDGFAAQAGLEELVAGHKKLSRGLFRNDLDRFLCVWGVGMTNLCRRNGLHVVGIPPLIPDDLLV